MKTKTNVKAGKVSVLVLFIAVAVAGTAAWQGCGPGGTRSRAVGSMVCVECDRDRDDPARRSSGFPVLMTFWSADGTMSQSRLYYLPAFGVLSTSFHGVWNRVHGNQIATTSLSLAQGCDGRCRIERRVLWH